MYTFQVGNNRYFHHVDSCLVRVALAFEGFAHPPMTKGAPSSTPAAKPRATSTLRAPRVLKVGTDFSGMEMPILALKKMNLQIKHCFASDKVAHCRRFIKHVSNPEVIYDSVCNRKVSEMAATDVYVFSPPCQPFSASGKQEGIRDSAGRGDLVKYGLKYMKVNQPRLVVMENVATLVSRHRSMFNKLCNTMAQVGYKVHWKILNTCRYGVPHHRPRVYVVAIRTDSLKRSYTWPADIDLTYTAADMVIPRPDDDPGRLPCKTVDARARGSVKHAFRKAMTKGVNPKQAFVAVDVDCSTQFRTHGVEIQPCLTATRGKTRGWWWSVAGRRIEIDEMCKTQGVDLYVDLPEWPVPGLKDSSMGHMLGNTMSLNVIERVLGSGLWAAGLVASKPVDRWAAQ